MNVVSSFEHLLVDPKDFDCGICYSRYRPITNEPVIMSPCGHPVCSACFKSIQAICPFCKEEISPNPIKNWFLSSFIERNSQVKKCISHQQPLISFCKSRERLVCCECIADISQGRYESLQKIERQIERIKHAKGDICKKKEESKKDIDEKLQKCSLNLKRKLDELFAEKIADDFATKKKLKRAIDTFTFSQEDQFLAQGLSKYEQDMEALESKWKENPQGDTAAQILKIPIDTKQASQFYNDKANQISKEIAEKETIFEAIIADQKAYFSENSSSILNKFLDSFDSKVQLDPKHNTIIARNYLLGTLEQYGLAAVYVPERDCIDIEASPKFSPKLFECSIEKLNFQCRKASAPEFQVLCDILQNIQGLSHLQFKIDKISSKILKAMSSYVLQSKTLQKLSFSMGFKEVMTDASKEFLQDLLNSKSTSHFGVQFYSRRLSVDWQQNLVQTSAKAFEEFSIEFVEDFPLFQEFIPIFSAASLANIKTLKKVTLHFSASIVYDEFLKDLMPRIAECQDLQELDIGFANTYFLEWVVGCQIPQIIKTCKELKKVSLFFSGSDNFDGPLGDLFRDVDPEAFVQHKLEEFSVTIMGYSAAVIEFLISYLQNFPRLAKLIVRMNKNGFEYHQIIYFLNSISELKSLVSFDFACRDHGRELTLDDEDEVDLCRDQFSQSNIQHKIVFEELELHHLPDYIKSHPDCQEDEEGENQEEGEEDDN